MSCMVPSTAKTPATRKKCWLSRQLAKRGTTKRTVSTITTDEARPPPKVTKTVSSGGHSAGSIRIPLKSVQSAQAHQQTTATQSASFRFGVSWERNWGPDISALASAPEEQEDCAAAAMDRGGLAAGQH